MNFYRSRVYGWIQFSTEKRIQQGMRERVSERDRKEANEPLPSTPRNFLQLLKQRHQMYLMWAPTCNPRLTCRPKHIYVVHYLNRVLSITNTDYTIFFVSSLFLSEFVLCFKQLKNVFTFTLATLSGQHAEYSL